MSDPMSVRDSLEAAYEKVTSSTEETSASESAPATEAAPAPVAAVDDAAAEPAGTDSAKSATDDGKSESRARGPDGKFVKPSSTKAPAVAKPAETKAPVADVPAATPAPVAATTTPTFKAPANWKADVREKFNALPPEIQAEIARVDGEWGKFKGSLESDKSYAAQVRQTIAPYEAMIRAEGGEPMKAVGSLLQTAAALRTGTPQTKAQLVAQMIHAYQIDVPTLAQFIDRAPQAQQTQQPVDPASIAAQVREELRREQQQAQMQEAQQSAQEWAQDKEFIEDVKADLAVILQTGRAKTLDDAYAYACKLHPEVSKVLAQREASKAATEAQAAAQRKGAASVSMKTQPSVTPATPKTRRELLEEAFAKKVAGR